MGTLTGASGSRDGKVDSKVTRTSTVLATILDTKTFQESCVFTVIVYLPPATCTSKLTMCKQPLRQYCSNLGLSIVERQSLDSQQEARRDLAPIKQSAHNYFGAHSPSRMGVTYTDFERMKLTQPQVGGVLGRHRMKWQGARAEQSSSSMICSVTAFPFTIVHW